MSTISVREWEVWQNNSFFQIDQELHGQFVLELVPALMQRQTIDFVYEQIDGIRQGHLSLPVNGASGYLSPLIWRMQPNLIYKIQVFRTADDIPNTLDLLLQELTALSMCVDYPLLSNHIEYMIPPGQPESGRVFIATRKPLVRGLAFEVEEREMAAKKLMTDFDLYALRADEVLRAAIQHYLSGLTLLGLEDQVSGLVDAAFMQFYQGCELLCESHRVDVAKRNFAMRHPGVVTKNTQIIIDHVWTVRNKYFGHHDLKHIAKYGDTYQVGKQVLVARWLCRLLIDDRIGVSALCREMRFYHGQTSEEFRGTVTELETTFKIRDAGKEITVYRDDGTKDYPYQTK
jgi:hypothetical protein